MDEIAHTINILLLSMATKQKVFDDLKSDVFTLDIFHSYIESLLSINIKLLGLSHDRIEDYQAMVELYLMGQIKDPDDIINSLKNCKSI